MLTYKAAFQFVEGGVHAHVIDFPGVITSGPDLPEVRRLLASALLDLANYCIDRGEPLPVPDPTLTDPDADVEEPLHLHLQAEHLGRIRAGRRGRGMKRRDLIRHLRLHGCQLAREGAEHSIWENPANNRRSAVPRHREILDLTARAICRQLGVPDP